MTMFFDAEIREQRMVSDTDVESKVVVTNGIKDHTIVITKPLSEMEAEGFHICVPLELRLKTK